MKKKSPDSRRVYSTEVGRSCPGCLRGVKDCICKSTHPTLNKESNTDAVVRLHRETKGRKGKGVTLIRGLPPGDSELKALAKKLKAGCGVGGAIKDGVIELQSADREKIKALLEGQGFSVKLAGS